LTLSTRACFCNLCVRRMGRFVYRVSIARWKCPTDASSGSHMRGNPGLTMAASFENLGRNNGSVGQSPCSEFGQSSSLGPYQFPEVSRCWSSIQRFVRSAIWPPCVMLSRGGESLLAATRSSVTIGSRSQTDRFADAAIYMGRSSGLYAVSR
jgi:hypothetical protein